MTAQLYVIRCIKDDRGRALDFPCPCVRCVAARNAQPVLLGPDGSPVGPVEPIPERPPVDPYEMRMAARFELDRQFEALGQSMGRLMWGDGDPDTWDLEKARQRWKAKPWHYRARVHVSCFLSALGERIALWLAPHLRRDDE